MKFVNWRTPGDGERDAARASAGRPRPLLPPLRPAPDQRPASRCRTTGRTSDCSGQTDEPVRLRLLPRAGHDGRQAGAPHADGSPATHYAWHFDAQLVADFLRRFATEKQGVAARRGRDDRGRRSTSAGSSPRCGPRAGGTLEGDLFVDCSGFRGLLINQAMGEPFIDMSDHLLCDSAVATAVPHDDEANGVEPYTSAIAMTSGWTWKIPMLGRFGTGYVYSSRFATQDEATEEFCRLWSLDPEKTPLNHIRFRVGRNRRAWVKNCVGIGLASCFLEPLESTGIYFIYAAHLPAGQALPGPALRPGADRPVQPRDRDDVRRHPGLHPGALLLRPAHDTPFWRANKDLTLTDEIQEKIAMYRAGLAGQPADHRREHLLRQLRGRVPQLLDQRQLLLHLRRHGTPARPAAAGPAYKPESIAGRRAPVRGGEAAAAGAGRDAAVQLRLPAPAARPRLDGHRARAARQLDVLGRLGGRQARLVVEAVLLPALGPQADGVGIDRPLGLGTAGRAPRGALANIADGPAPRRRAPAGAAPPAAAASSNWLHQPGEPLASSVLTPGPPTTGFSLVALLELVPLRNSFCMLMLSR